MAGAVLLVRLSEASRRSRGPHPARRSGGGGNGSGRTARRLALVLRPGPLRRWRRSNWAEPRSPSARRCLAAHPESDEALTLAALGGLRAPLASSTRPRADGARTPGPPTRTTSIAIRRPSPRCTARARGLRGPAKRPTPVWSRADRAGAGPSNTTTSRGSRSSPEARRRRRWSTRGARSHMNRAPGRRLAAHPRDPLRGARPLRPGARDRCLAVMDRPGPDRARRKRLVRARPHRRKPTARLDVAARGLRAASRSPSRQPRRRIRPRSSRKSAWPALGKPPTPRRPRRSGLASSAKKPCP